MCCQDRDRDLIHRRDMHSFFFFFLQLDTRLKLWQLFDNFSEMTTRDLNFK